MLFSFEILYWPLYAAILGLCIGSLLNVVIYRLPIMLKQEEENYLIYALRRSQPLMADEQQLTPTQFSLFLPRSHCPQCKKTIAYYDNIPLLSWLLLGRRCRHCHTRIAWRYPAVESTMMMISLALAYYFPAGGQWLLLSIFCALLITLALIDFDHLLLPDLLTYPLLWTGLVWHSLYQTDFLPEAIIGAIAGYMILWLVYWIGKRLTNREGLGYGDFKLLAALGAWFGWQNLPEIVLVAASLTILAQLPNYRSKQAPWLQPVPFGPGLAAAGFWLMISKLVL